MFGMSKGAQPNKRKTKPAGDEDAAAVARRKASASDGIEVTVALTPAQADKLQRLGGTAWILAQIDKGKAPQRD